MAKRGRPKKPRNIERAPHIRQFSPRGERGRPGYTDLAADQYEALRLTDFISLNQKEAAASMGISQQTFSRVLKGARKALTEGVVLGHTIRIKEIASAVSRPRNGKRVAKKPA